MIFYRVTRDVLVKPVIPPVLHECQCDLSLQLWINQVPQKFAGSLQENKPLELKTIDYANESLQHMC